MATVSTSAFYQRTTGDIARLRRYAESLQTALASGQRLARGSDDPVAASRLRGLERMGSLAEIDKGNAQRASTDLQLTDNALDSMARTTTRIRELAVQAASGTLNPTQRSAIGKEVSQLRQELVGLANGNNSAGHALFGGLSNGPAYALDGGGNAVYQGSASAGQIDLGDGQAMARGLTGPEVLNFAGTDLFAVTKALADALAGGVADPAQAARTALGALDSGLETLATAQTITGTRLAWIEVHTDRQVRQDELRAEEEAELGGTDIAATVTRLQQTMTVLEASQASFVRLAQLSLFDLIRG